METSNSERDLRPTWPVEKHDQEVGITRLDTGNDDSDDICFHYLSGWRLHAIALG
jgi:hypothetical protein